MAHPLFLAFLYLTVTSAKFRSFLGWVIVLGMGLMVVIAIASEVSKDDGETEAVQAEDAESPEVTAQPVLKTVTVSTDQVDFIDFRLTLGMATPSLAGWVKNNSPHTLKRVTVAIGVDGCTFSGQCGRLGNKEVEITFQDGVLPHSDRQVSHQFLFAGLPEIRGQYQWSWEVIAASGISPAP
jgi:hypothetical protein